MMPCPVCGKCRHVAEHLAALRNPPPHDPRRCWRCGGKLRRIAFALPRSSARKLIAPLIVVAPLLPGCAG